MRAASGLSWVGDRLAICQDDALLLALVDPARPEAAVAVPLPRRSGEPLTFSAAEGTKRSKPDLECLVCVGDTLLGLGSGSRPARERVLVARRLGEAAPSVALVEASAFYTALRDCREFSGSELNVEGAALVDASPDARSGPRLRLYNRGNGRRGGAVPPRNATLEIDALGLLAWLDAGCAGPVPALGAVTEWDLGSLEGVRLTFTDACAAGDKTVLFLAAAETSPDAYDDGEVAGVALGVDDGVDPRLAPCLDDEGRPFRHKAEGLVVDQDGSRHGWLVVDADDPDRPATLHRFSW